MRTRFLALYALAILAVGCKPAPPAPVASTYDSVRVAAFPTDSASSTWAQLRWGPLKLNVGDSVKLCAYAFAGGAIVAKSDTVCPDPVLAVVANLPWPAVHKVPVSYLEDERTRVASARR